MQLVVAREDVGVDPPADRAEDGEEEEDDQQGDEDDHSAHGSPVCIKPARARIHHNSTVAAIVPLVPKLKANPKRVLTAETLPEYVQAYLAVLYACKQMEQRVAEMKATMMAYLAEHGVENANGHRIIDVEDVALLTRQRRVDETFLEDMATRWLEKKGLRDEVIHEVTIEEFDYDQFMALLFDRKVPQREIDNFYERNEKFAFLIKAHA